MTRLTVLRSVGVAILSSVAALATITNTTTCSYNGMTVTEPSSCAGQHGSDGAFATATVTVISGYNVSVTALASADAVNNDQADGGPTDFASASAGVTQQFYSNGPAQQGFISIAYELESDAHGSGDGTYVLQISDADFLYSFTCPVGAGDNCAGTEVVAFNLGTPFTVTATADAAAVAGSLGSNGGGAGSQVQFTLEDANGAVVETFVPEPGSWTLWLAGLALLMPGVVRREAVERHGSAARYKHFWRDQVAKLL